MAWEDIESTMTVAIYQALGNLVSYDGQGAATVSIYAIVDDGSELFGFESDTAEGVAQARIKVTDVATPRRNDCLTMASGLAYVVDAVERTSNVEWTLTMKERDR